MRVATHLLLVAWLTIAPGQSNVGADEPASSVVNLVDRSTALVTPVALAAGGDGAAGRTSDCSCCQGCSEPWVVSRQPISCCSCSFLDGLTDLGQSIHNGCDFKMPITGGAWHWWHQSLIGRQGGYGIPGIRDTYFWYLYADPSYQLANGRTLGGHVELRLRETGTFRSFIDQQVWTWESYVSIRHQLALLA